MRMSVGTVLALCLVACGQPRAAGAQDSPAALVEPIASESISSAFAAADEMENIELVSSSGVQLVRSASGTLFLNGIEIGNCMAGVGSMFADVDAELHCNDSGFELTLNPGEESVVTFSQLDTIYFQIIEAAGQSDFELAYISDVPLSDSAVAFISQDTALPPAE